MPLTVPSHQAFVLPIKLAWPRHVDGTALCIGAAAPDLAYPLGDWLNRQSHTAIGVLVWAVPATIVIAWLVRWRVAAGLFAQLPDCGPFRLRSYRALGLRRPPFWVTLASAVVGAASHVLVDAFTHTGRWGANWLHLNDPIGELPLRGEMSAARVLQYIGHIGGAVVAIALLAYIGNQRLMERWYGGAAVARARAVRVLEWQRLVFWAMFALPPVVALLLADLLSRHPLFPFVAGLAVGLLLAGALPLWEPASPAEEDRHASDVPKPGNPDRSSDPTVS